eukprot:1350710-Amorphochlora_amoeboformis.AAC.1
MEPTTLSEDSGTSPNAWPVTLANIVRLTACQTGLLSVQPASTVPAGPTSPTRRMGSRVLCVLQIQ